MIPSGRALDLVYRFSEDVDPLTRTWVTVHIPAIKDHICDVIHSAGIEGCRLVAIESLSAAEVDSLRRIRGIQGRAETLTPGRIELIFAGRNAGFHRDDAPIGLFGFTNTGRAALFLDVINFRRGRACDRVCVISQVALHEIGHALGFEAPAHNWFGFSLSEWFRTSIRRAAPDIMEGSRPLPDEPREFNLENAVNRMAIMKNTKSSGSY